MIIMKVAYLTPGKGVPTQRYRDIEIKTAQSDSGNWYFSGAAENSEGKSVWDKGNMKQDQENRILESVCIQHEIDHLNGKVIMDRRKNMIVRTEKKIGRNQLVTIKKGDAVKVLKYKKIQSFLNDGWVMQ